MITALKLIKEDKELILPCNPTVYMFAIEKGWNWELITIDESIVFNNVNEIE